MPIYMDVHIVPGVKAKDVAEAHQRDIFHQHEHECKCMTYWIDEERENIFCLIEAPTKQAVEQMHNKAHGLIPNKIIEVNSSLVESFLGRIYDPEEAEITSEGLKVFSEPSFRILLVTKIEDPALLRYRFGEEKSTHLLNTHNNIIRKNLAQHGGREVEQAGPGFIISFNSASKAVNCGLAIHRDMEMAGLEELCLKMGISAGEPVEKSNNLFGDALQLAYSLCTIAGPAQIALASSVKEMVAREPVQKGNQLISLSPQDEALLVLLFNKLGDRFHDPDFDIVDYGQATAMSQSQLYRKTISLTGFSPNALLKEFRLEKARELMKQRRYNIAQITFDTGFTSPSYFTKCFKKKFGLLPMAYVDLLH